MNIAERPQQREKIASPEFGSRPKPTFHGMLVTPETISPLPKRETPVATFNAGIVSFPRPDTDEMVHVAMYRVMAHEHIADVPDATDYFALQEFSLVNGKVVGKPIQFIEAKSLLSSENQNLNPEDIRLIWDDVTQTVKAGLTVASSVSPLVGYLEGTPSVNLAGQVTINFSPVEVAKERKNDGNIGSVEGKNVQVEITPEGQVLRYRPLSVDDKLNRTYFRTIKKGEEGLYAQVGQDGVYNPDLSQLLPEGHTLYTFGLNGRHINLPNGEKMRVDHVCSTAPDGKIEYGFITVNGKIKPLLSYEEVMLMPDIQALGLTENDLTGDKRVIYSNGSTIIADEKGNDHLLMAVTLFDTSVAMLSYNLNELASYASSIEGNKFLESTFPHFNRDRRLPVIN